MDGLYEEKYGNLSDEELLAIIRRDREESAQDYLIDKYKNMVKVKARTYFLIGADQEDLMQEGMIGLFKAIRDYKPEKTSSFFAFAWLCVDRQMITAIKTATRQKHKPLNTYVSLNMPSYDKEGDSSIMRGLSYQRYMDPEELFIDQEEKSFIETRLSKNLSKLERRVLSLYLKGKDYEEIAEIVSKDTKAIDNALQRVKKKVGKILIEKGGNGR